MWFALVLAAGTLLATRLTTRFDHADPSTRSLGIISVWVLLAVVMTTIATGASYAFAWPALAAVGGAYWQQARWLLGRFSLVAVPTLLLLVPPIDFLVLFAQPRPGNPDSSIPATMLVPLLLALAVVGLLGRWTEGAGELRPGASRGNTAPPRPKDRLQNG